VHRGAGAVVRADTHPRWFPLNPLDNDPVQNGATGCRQHQLLGDCTRETINDRVWSIKGDTR
jgi:hypothetical protein